MRTISQALIPKGNPVELVPCRIVTTSPLTVDFYDTPTYPGVKLAGLTYSTGAALALVSSPGLPIILPIGA